MTRTAPVPISRISQHLSRPSVWCLVAWQGPGGLYAVEATTDGRYQVHSIHRGQVPTNKRESEPFMTPEGARRFAEGLAARVDEGR